jgi:MFS family permease
VAERGDRFLLLLALAYAGGMIAYVPLLTLLLPAKVALLAGEARVEWLGAATLAGAVAASLANIAFGWASDRIGTRRIWAGAGLCLTLATYALVHAAASPGEIVASIVVYQVALNMLLSPIAAWAADRVPDRRKGLLGGLFGAAPPIAALAGVVATLPVLEDDWMQLAAVCGLMVVLIVPLLLSRAPAYADPPPAVGAGSRPTAAWRDFILLWSARLLVQVAGSLLFAFLFYYFQSLPAPASQAEVAKLSALSLLIAFPAALAAGHLSDRLGPRKPFLIGAAAVAALGLGLLAWPGDRSSAAIGYALFASGSAVFLALHSGFAMQLLPSPRHRGRDLGVLNLANTLPAIVAPLLAIWLVPGRGFSLLLGLLAALTVLAAGCVMLVRQDRQRT